MPIQSGEYILRLKHIIPYWIIILLSKINPPIILERTKSNIKIHTIEFVASNFFSKGALRDSLVKRYSRNLRARGRKRKAVDFRRRKGIWNEAWEQSGIFSFHRLANIWCSDRNERHKRTNLSSQIRLLSKEKRNHGNSARLTREQWRGPRGFENSRHGTMKPVLSARCGLLPSLSLSLSLLYPTAIYFSVCYKYTV